MNRALLSKTIWALSRNSPNLAVQMMNQNMTIGDI